MRNRRYDATTSRSLTRDPLGYADDVNMYRYVANSPLMYTDPMGEEKVLTRVGGARDMLFGFMNMVGGGAQLAGAGALCSTGLGCVAGVVLGVNGANDMIAGFSHTMDGLMRVAGGKRVINLSIDPLQMALDATVSNDYAKFGITAVLNLDPAGIGRGMTKLGVG